MFYVADYDIIRKWIDENGKYLRKIYFAKLLWFYNCSIEDFKTSEA